MRIHPERGDALLSRLEMEATQLLPADAINPTKCIPNLDTIWEGVSASIPRGETLDTFRDSANNYDDLCGIQRNGAHAPIFKNV